MLRHISTGKSELISYDFSNYKDLINKCIIDIKDSLNEYPKIFVYGRECIQHRSIGFFSDKSIGYTYSRKLESSQNLTDNLKKLLEIINTFFKSDFNGILINKYLDGNEYISSHSDDEKEISENGVISISVGAVRKFRIRDKSSRKIVKDIPTEPYNVIHMNGDFQKEFLHEIPIEKKIKDCRYSLTFRKHTK